MSPRRTCWPRSPPFSRADPIRSPLWAERNLSGRCCDEGSSGGIVGGGSPAPGGAAGQHRGRVMTGPVLRALKENLPGSHITLLASPGGSKAAPLLPWVDEVLAWRVMWDPGRFSL